MSRARNVTPSYIPHTKSGRGRLQWDDPTGTRREELLPGPFGSPESLAAKARLELELATAPTRPSATDAADGPVYVGELLLAFLDHAERHYRRPDGTPTHEIDEFRLVIRYLRELHGTTPVDHFGPLALKTLRQAFVDTAR